MSASWFVGELSSYRFYWTFESSLKLCTNYFVFIAIYAMSVTYTYKWKTLDHTFRSNSNSPRASLTNSERVTSNHDDLS